MDTLFFYLSKTVWPLLQPDALIIYVLVAILFLMQTGRHKAAKWLTAVTAVLLLVVAVFPIGDWMLYKLESRFPVNPPLPRQVDGIIVLGGTIDALSSVEWEQVELSASVDRLIAFAALARRYPRAQLVMSGGSGDILSQDYREADVAGQFFDTIGLDTDRVILERESRNTMENVMYSREQVKPAAGENWIVVTSAFHMPRTMGIFCKQQWQVIPWPVDHYTSSAGLKRLHFNLLGNLQTLVFASHEWAGLLVYRLTGRTSTLFPADCNRL
jgi:uncharacterized SAM-binding protein YcdF (DUF218 family)